MAPRKKPEPDKPTKAKAPPTRGRPTEYRPEYVEQAAKLCSQFAATDPELAEFFGVAISTIRLWMVKHPAFSEAVKLNKDLADDRMERRLYELGMGYSFDSEEIKVIEGEVVRVPITEHVPPSPVSQIFWLKNRRRKEWLDGFVVKHELPTAEEIAAAKKKLEGEI